MLRILSPLLFLLFMIGMGPLQSAPEPVTAVTAAVAKTAPAMMLDDNGAPIEEVAVEEELSDSGALIEKLKESGKTGLALFIISIAGFSFAFERLFNLRKSGIVPAGLANNALALWKDNKFDELENLATSSKSVLGKVIVEIVNNRQAHLSEVSTMAGDIASREMRLHLQRAYPLAVVATISPLLGLFGTVYGMIGAFESVALAGEMGDPSIMAADIAFALMTTALGLVIAVPALTCYHFFRIRTNLLALGLEEQASHLLGRWFPTMTRNTDKE
jgi:biopolymer transport protein ExbB